MRVLYIDIDSQRPDHLGCCGYHRDTSPNIDAVAEVAVRFDNIYVSDAPCLPSRTALGVRLHLLSKPGTNSAGTIWSPTRMPGPASAGCALMTISVFAPITTGFG